MSKTHTFLVSDESVNSYGFKVLTNGIDTKRFETNPIMLYMHERPNIIGKWENVRKENAQLFADAVFDVEDPTAKEIAGKVERGFLKCASVGIGKADLKDGIVSSCELFEISIVDIGSNSNALRLYTDTEETIQLKLNEFSALDGLSTILGFKNEINHTQIVSKVKDLLSLNNEYKTKLDTYSSFAFSSDEVMKADGTVQIYERINDPELRATVIGFDKRFIALPIRNKAIGAIISAKI